MKEELENEESDQDEEWFTKYNNADVFSYFYFKQLIISFSHICLWMMSGWVHKKCSIEIRINVENKYSINKISVILNSFIRVSCII